MGSAVVTGNGRESNKQSPSRRRSRRAGKKAPKTLAPVTWGQLLSKELEKPEDLKDIRAADGSSSESVDYVNEVKRLRALISKGNEAVIEDYNERAARTDNGKVKVVYQQYAESFKIVNGAIRVFDIDDKYCLSDAMPGCRLALVDVPLQEMHEREASGIHVSFAKKTVKMAAGAEGATAEQEFFCDLYTYREGSNREDKQYYIVVYEDPEQYERDMEKMRARIEEDTNGVVEATNAQRVEGCSCLEGNPCTEANKYNCKNWENRMAIATANGWKGF